MVSQLKMGQEILYIKHKSSITVALKVDAKGKWFIYCHICYIICIQEFCYLGPILVILVTENI